MGNFLNQANTASTNIFETLIGALNLAPIKLSGQYKIIVDVNGNFFLNDYTERRVVLDKTKSFLQQVANFLKVKTSIYDTTSLQYGAFSRSVKKYFHIPIYFSDITNSETYPKYFALSRVANETILDETELYKYGTLLKVVDLEKIGLFKIFDEINSESKLDYPLYFNWEESCISLFGYSITENVSREYKMPLVDIQANQPYFEVFNNKIMNAYVEQNIIFPRFLNIEFEFEYGNEYEMFSNFYGFLSGNNSFSELSKFDNSYCVALKNHVDTIEWRQEFKTSEVLNISDIELEPYKTIMAVGSVQEVNIQQAQIRFEVNIVKAGDEIRIVQDFGNDDFVYRIKSTDIISDSLLQTMIKIGNACTMLSGKKFQFSVTQKPNKNCIVKIIISDLDKLSEQYYIQLPNSYVILDRFEIDKNIVDSNYYYFRGIYDTDVWLGGQPNLLDNVSTVMVDEITYNIVEKFKFDGKTIIRFDAPVNIDKQTNCVVFEDNLEILVSLSPINFLNFNSDLESLQCYDQQSYVDNLKTKFTDEDSLTAIDKFNRPTTNPNFQYVVEDLANNIIDDCKNVVVEDFNKDIVKNSMFASMGCSSFITPNILNIDKRFYVQNGNLDANILDSDSLRYNWFSIKGECPEYLKGDVRSLRYFLNEPNLTSRLIKTSDSFCETIYLGVKYQMPVKYANFNFAVYLNPDVITHSTLNYDFVINLDKKLVCLSINKYFDFIDLLRGGDVTNTPLIDLSFFYNCINSFNEKSKNLEAFKTIGIQICPEISDGEITYIYDAKIGKSWYGDYLGKKYFLVKRENVLLDISVTNFKLLISETTERYDFVIYSQVNYNGKPVNFPNIIVTAVGITDVKEDQFWCEDITFRFVKPEYISIYDSVLEKDVILPTASITHIGSGTEMIENYRVTFVGGIVKDVKLYNFEIVKSFAKDYFEIIQESSTDSADITRSVLKFQNPLSDAEIIQRYIDNVPIDRNVNQSQITLFNREQEWVAVKQLLRTQVKIKDFFEAQVRKIINEVMVNNLVDYTELNSVKINGTEDVYIKLNVVDIDKNIAIWKLLGTDKVSVLNRFSTAYVPFLQLFENVKDFQLPKHKMFNTIFNVYDKNFGGENISATGIWKEVKGNVVSSLFSKQNPIELSIQYEPDVDYKKILIRSTILDDCIINNNNYDYLSKINKNVNEYITESYVSYLLDNHYKFDYVLNEFGQRVNYTIDNKNRTLLHFTPIENYDTIFYELIFVFKRK